MSHPHAVPPTEWLTGLVTQVTDDLYFERLDDPYCLTSWHWCAAAGRWQALPVQHAVVQKEKPLHLESPLLFSCCGMHGWVRNGEWKPA